MVLSRVSMFTGICADCGGDAAQFALVENRPLHEPAGDEDTVLQVTEYLCNYCLTRAAQNRHTDRQRRQEEMLNSIVNRMLGQGS